MQLVSLKGSLQEKLSTRISPKSAKYIYIGSDAWEATILGVPTTIRSKKRTESDDYGITHTGNRIRVSTVGGLHSTTKP
jgi:hypothetical protein